MKHHIFEHCGVMLHVDYTMGSDATPKFHSIRVMDDQYRPTGPDLRPLLHQTLILHKEPTIGLRADVHTFLSAIAMELP